MKPARRSPAGEHERIPQSGTKAGVFGPEQGESRRNWDSHAILAGRSGIVSRRPQSWCASSRPNLMCDKTKQAKNGRISE
jgi:hypothetical protein